MNFILLISIAKNLYLADTGLNLQVSIGLRPWKSPLNSVIPYI